MSDAFGNIDLGALGQNLSPIYSQFGIAPPEPMPGVTPSPAVPGITPSEGVVSSGKNLANPVIIDEPEIVTYDAYTEYLKQKDEMDKATTRSDARLLLSKSLKGANLESLTDYVFELQVINFRLLDLPFLHY